MDKPGFPKSESSTSINSNLPVSPGNDGPQERHMGCMRDTYNEHDQIYSTCNRSYDDLPEIFDIRTLIAIPIANQLNTNSCVAQSISLQLLYLLKRSQSPLFLYYNARWLAKMATHKDEGVSFRSVFNGIKRYGTSDKREWGFIPSKVNEIPISEAYLKAQILPYTPKRINPIPFELCHALHETGVIVLGMEVYSNFNELQTPWFYQKPTKVDTYQGRHAISMIAYNIADQYFTCVNSWGSKWADGGAFRIAFEDIGEDRLFSDFWSLEGVE